MLKCSWGILPLKVQALRKNPAETVELCCHHHHHQHHPDAPLLSNKRICFCIRLGDYSTILTGPEVNNCFTIFTRSDLNTIRKETIKKRLVLLTDEFMREHEAVKSGCAKVRSLHYLQTWQMIVLIFLYRVL